MEKEFFIDNTNVDLKNEDELKDIIKRVGGINQFNLTIMSTINGTDFILKDKFSSIKVTVSLLHRASTEEIQEFKKIISKF